MSEGFKFQARGDRGAPIHCPYCRDVLGVDPEPGICTACETAQHLACFREHARCSVAGCGNRRLFHQGVVISTLSGEERTLTPREAGLAEARPLSRRRQLLILLCLAALAALGGLLEGSTTAVLVGIAFCGGMALWSVLDGGSLTEAEQLELVRRRILDAQTRAQGIGAPSLWHDVPGQDGFDPITGAPPPPRIPRPEPPPEDEEDPS